jgi:hypothetical protein
MSENSGRPGDARKFRSFTECFCWHFKNGTRNNKLSGQAWLIPEFDRALNEQLNHQRKTESRRNTVKNWLENGAIPGEWAITAILYVFFGEHSADLDGQELAKLWRDARARDDEEIRGKRDGLAKPERWPAGDVRSSDWVLAETTVMPDLVELRLHSPHSGNEVQDSYYVKATLFFGTAICDYDPDDGQEPRTISIALRDARLAIGSESYRPLQGTMVGERLESNHFKRVAGGLHITGPAPCGTLDGNPIGDQHLAVMAGTNTGEETFAVTVAANRRSFVVVDLQARSGDQTDGALLDNKNAILNVLIYKNLRKDESGRAVLASATMRHTKEVDRSS